MSGLTPISLVRQPNSGTVVSCDPILIHIRWFGRAVYDVFVGEFVRYSPEYYVSSLVFVFVFDYPSGSSYRNRPHHSQR